MYDEGSEECVSDTQWDDDSYMSCEECGFHRTAADFKEQETPDHLFVTNEDGITFAVRLVQKGDRYGLHGCLTHDIDKPDGPLVEFYDTRYDHNSDWLEEFKGQFVSRYYAETLLGHDGGLCLDGGVSDWHVSAGNMIQIKKWLKARGVAT
jgi:hypothetical protein